VIIINDREILELLLHKVTNIETDVAVIKSDVVMLKDDVSIIQADVVILQSDVNVIKSDYKNLAQKVDIILAHKAGLTELQEVTTNRLNQLEEDQISIKEIIGEQAVSIRTIKRNMFFSMAKRIKVQTS
jgi:hypothetical protein